MNTALFVFLIIIGFLLFLGLLIVIGIYVHSKRARSDDDIPQNRAFALNFTDQNENFIFIETDSKIVKEDGTRNNVVVCRSYEVDFDNDGNPVPPDKAHTRQLITTKKERRITFARGTLDADREIIFYLPEHLENTDDSFKNTKLFAMLEPLIHKNDALESTIHSYVKANEKNKHLIDLLLTSNLDENLMKKLKVMKNIMGETENDKPKE